MNKRICTLEYIAKEIEIGIKNNTIDREVKQNQDKCLYCNPEIRCDYYIPLIRIQHIREGDMLYRKKYLKKK